MTKVKSSLPAKVLLAKSAPETVTTAEVPLPDQEDMSRKYVQTVELVVLMAAPETPSPIEIKGVDCIASLKVAVSVMVEESPITMD